RMRAAECGARIAESRIWRSLSFQYACDLNFEHARLRQYKIRWQWDCDNHIAFKRSAIGLSAKWPQSAIGKSAIRDRRIRNPQSAIGESAIGLSTNRPQSAIRTLQHTAILSE